MLSIDEIQEYLIGQNKAFNFDIRLRPSDEAIMVYVPRIKVVPKVQKGFISVRQINNIKKNLSNKYSRETEVIFVQGDAQQDLEAGFFQMLNRKFDDQIVSLFTSFSNENVVDAFIEATELNEALQDEISNQFKSILEEADLKLGVLKWLDSPMELPSLIAVLRSLKIHQPVSLHALKVELRKDYSSIKETWLNHKLDQLRKKGYIIRQKVDGTYVLTTAILKVIPAGTRRSSSDISRALALGKRKW